MVFVSEYAVDIYVHMYIIIIATYNYELCQSLISMIRKLVDQIEKQVKMSQSVKSTYVDLLLECVCGMVPKSSYFVYSGCLILNI